MAGLTIKDVNRRLNSRPENGEASLRPILIMFFGVPLATLLVMVIVAQFV